MAHHLVDELTRRIEQARQIIEDNNDDVEEPEFDLGYLFCLQSICDDLGTDIHFFNFQKFANTHLDFVCSIEKSIIDDKNINSQELKKWASPIAHRITDEMTSIENGSEEHSVILSAIEKLLFHNPSFAAAFIGTGVIEADYFDELR